MLRRLLSAISVAVGLLTYSNTLAADEANRLELPQEIEVEKGAAELQLPILMTNAVSMTGFQCDLYLPNGFAVATDEYGDYLMDVARTTTKRHSIATREMGDGALRIVLSSMTNAVFSGNSGAVLNITVSISSGVSTGNHTVSLKNIVLTDPQAARYVSSDVSGTIVVKAEEQPVTITAQNLTMVYGDAVPTLSYTTEGAELKGVPSLSCEATSSSPVGTYPIVVSQGTVENNKVTYVNGTLTITRAPLTASVGNYTRKQGEANPEFVISYEGFKNDETESVLKKKPTATTTATATSEPGEYEIVVGGGEAQNYELSYKNGKLTIVKADAVVITAKSYTRLYGDANPAFEYTVEGAALDGEPEIVCEATPTSPVGEYPIVIRKGSVKNYNDTYVNGTLTITKAPLTVTANSFSITQGDALPTFTATYAGFRNNETENVLTKKPKFTCAATSSSAPGTYEIVVSGAEAKNYNISYVNGKLVVKAPDPVLVTSITLNKTQATLSVGQTLQLTATIAPDNASNKNLTWKSSSTGVATVSTNGLVTAKANGSVTITATTQDGSNLSAQCQVTVQTSSELLTKIILHLSDNQTFEYFENQIDSITFIQVEPDPEPLSCPDDNHPHAIDLGLTSGVKWSCCNVGASIPEAYGGYYSWGEMAEKNIYIETNYQYYKGDDYNGDGWIDNNLTVVNIGSNITNTTYDVAKLLMGTPWRMPTKNQMDELMLKCSFEWTELNGVNGFRVTGPNGHYIFLPAAGNRWDSETRNAGSEGCYWTSTVYSSDSRDAYDMQVHPSSKIMSHSRRYDGRSVRAICR